MEIKKKVSFAFLVISSLSLTACHENPLRTEPRSVTISFLQKAAIYAESRMNLPKRAVGFYYHNCMTDNSKNIDCTDFFNEMLQFAKSDRVFTNLTYQDISDRKTYAVLEEDYRSKLFNTDPSELE